MPPHGPADLADGREHGVGEDVFANPGVGRGDTAVAADGLDKGNTVVFQAAFGCFHIGADGCFESPG